MSTWLRTVESASRPWLPCVAAVAAALSGCATLHPVPAGDQPVASTTVNGVVVSVPRLDTGDYPGDVLDVSTAVLVVIENRGSTEILIDPEGFSLGAGTGATTGPIAPQQLSYKQPKGNDVTPGLLDQEGVALAWRGGGGFRGGGGGFRMSAPAPRVGGSYGGYRGGGSVRVAPSYRGGSYGSYGGYRGGSYGSYRSYGGFRPGYGGYRGYYAPRSYAWGQSRWRYWAGGPLYWGPNWGYGWYGSSLFWPWFYDGPRAYAWSQEDAQELALPAGKLPPGARTGGFLYFPKIENSDGAPLVLQWSIRESTGQQVIGTAQLPLEMKAD